MKILSLGNCPLDRNLGSGKTCLAWSEGLRGFGHEVEFIDPSGFELWPGLQKGKKFRQALGAWRLLKTRSLKDYDLVEFYGDEFWLATWLLSRRSTRPFLVAHTNGLELLASERALYYKETKGMTRRIYEFLARPLLSKMSEMAFIHTDAFVTLCSLDQDYVLKHHLFIADRSEVVPPGLDDEYIGVPFQNGRRNSVAFMGNWIDRKGIDAMGQVMTNILRQNPDVEFDVFGTGGATQTVHASFPSDIHHKVNVHGRLTNNEIVRQLSTTKIFFFPTRYEGFGMALSEAMACGCATITTPTGFGAELKHGIESILCDFDDWESMEKAISSLLEDETQRAMIAKQGHRRVQGLSWKVTVKKLEETYLRWLTDRTAELNKSNEYQMAYRL